jgi:hypothetical protein
LKCRGNRGQRIERCIRKSCTYVTVRFNRTGPKEGAKTSSSCLLWALWASSAGFAVRFYAHEMRKSQSKEGRRCRGVIRSWILKLEEQNSVAKMKRKLGVRHRQRCCCFAAASREVAASLFYTPSLLELKVRRRLVGPNPPGHNVCLKVVLTAHRCSGQSAEHGNLPHMR